MTTKFNGFSRDGLAVLRGLAKDNSKEYFDAHRAPFDEGVVEAGKLFVVELAAAMSDQVGEPVTANPKVDGSIFRIRRDTRFSKDKTPYKTNQAFFVWQGKSKKEAPGFYVSIDLDSVLVGVGNMALDVEKWRKAIARPKTGAAFQAAYDKADRALPKLTGPEPTLKRVPKGFDPEHARAHWLRLKVFNTGTRQPLPKSVHNKRFLDWCVKRLEPMVDVHRWLVKHT